MSSTSYPYEKDGILPDGLKIPDIPIMNLLFVRRDLKRGLVGESVVDTGFDAGIYPNLNLVEFLEGSRPRRMASLEAAGHSVSCEVYCPMHPLDLSEDVIAGRAILNRIKLELNGRLTKLSM